MVKVILFFGSLDPWKESSACRSKLQCRCILYTASGSQCARGAPFSVATMVGYVAPATLAETLTLLGEHGRRARILSGGQSLVPLLNTGMAQPELLLDLRNLVDLRYIALDGGAISLGALTRHADIEGSVALQTACPVLPAAAGWIGHPQIRNRGTIGGSLAHADPAAELPLVLGVLGASVTLADAAGQRALPVTEFLQGPYTTVLKEGELLTAVVVPTPPSGHGWSFHEMARRHGDFASAAAAAVVTPRGRGLAVRFGVCGQGYGPYFSAETEWPDKGLTAEAVLGLAKQASEAVDPPGDHYLSAAYKRKLVAEVARRAIQEAADRAARQREGGRDR